VALFLAWAVVVESYQTAEGQAIARHLRDPQASPLTPDNKAVSFIEESEETEDEADVEGEDEDEEANLDEEEDEGEEEEAVSEEGE
jgi:hypothetical protein